MKAEKIVIQVTQSVKNIIFEERGTLLYMLWPRLGMVAWPEYQTSHLRRLGLH